MTIFHRRILYLFFIILFIITAPVIVYYALGYRYDFKKGVLEQTGVLFLETQPRSASVYLNGVLQKKTTPLRFNNLLPNDYEIILTKDGYQDWRRTVAVYPKQTTFIYDITLFKKNILLKDLMTGDFKNATLSPNKKSVAAILIDNENKNADRIIVYDLNDRKNSVLGEVAKNAAKSSIAWSADSRRFVLENPPHQAFIINGAIQAIFSYTESNATITQTSWAGSTENIANFLKDGLLHQINVKTNKVDKLFNNQITDYYFLPSALYYLEPSANQVLLKRTNPPFFNQTEIITSLPLSTRYRFLKFDEQKNSLLIHDWQNELLYVLNLAEQLPQREILTQVEHVDFFNDDTLLYYNDFEIWTYNVVNKQKNLITRLGHGVDYAVWHPTGRHIIFASAGEIKIIETENGSQNIITELTAFEKVNFMTPDDKGQFLFVNGVYTGQPAFWQMEIQ